jgi:hypothetical protein
VTITFEVRLLADYLRLDCAGTYSQESALELYRQAFELAARANRDAVLIDGRKVTGREPTLAERYAGAVLVSELQSSQTPRIRLAVLGNEPIIHPERFGEIVATNRGAVARAFTDENAALDWLLATPRSR